MGKRIDGINRFNDLIHLPAPCYLVEVCTLIVLVLGTFSVCAYSESGLTLFLWLATVLIFRFAALGLLRAGDQRQQPPQIEDMHFWDESRLPLWVHLVDVAATVFWIVLSWMVFTYEHSARTLIAILIAVSLVNLWPVALLLCRRPIDPTPSAKQR